MDAQVSILVVEDNIDDIMILRRHFSRLDGNYRVDIAYTAAEAMGHIVHGAFDIVFVDHHLPDARGEHLVREIRAAAPTLPVVMLTGRGDERLAVEVMKAGAADYLRKDTLSRAILARSVRNVLERAALEARVRAARAELEQLAIRDGLTGLINRRHFATLLSRELARAERYDEPLACLMLDVDHFKRFNDDHGHQCGDNALRHVATVLQGVAREVDVVARYGGEEFVVLLPNTDLTGALRMAERVREQIEARPVEFNGARIDTTASVGVATTLEEGVDSAEALIKRADDGLYLAKRTGRNRVGHVEVTAAPLTIDSVINESDAVRALAQVVDCFEACAVGRPNHSQVVAQHALRLAMAVSDESAAHHASVLVARLRGVGLMVLPEALWWATPDAAGATRRRQAPLLAAALLGDVGLPAEVLEALIAVDERWDGAGCPDGLAGEMIPFAARVVAIADRWCRLIAPTPERAGLSPVVALAQLAAEAGERFDPALVDVFSQLPKLTRDPA